MGDEVVIYGPFVNYKGNTPESVQKEACIFTINGKKEYSSGGGEQGGEDKPVVTSEGINISGTTVTLTNANTEAGTETLAVTVNDLGIEDKASAVGT